MQNNKLPQEFISELKTIIAADRVLFDEPMSRHSTFRIGGPADCLVMPENTAETAALLSLARHHGVPVTILGNASNVLVRDRGIRGVVVKFGKDMSAIRREGGIVTAGAGALLAEVSRFAADHELTGLEFAFGIPGSLGGAVYMNAGAYDGEISRAVTAVTAITANSQIVRYENGELKFGYRHSAFQDNGAVICEVEMTLSPGIAAEIKAKMDDYTVRRRTKQPLEMPSAGSTFKRPPGHFAGSLIEQTGLKGMSVGGAQVSLKHAGFIVNTGDATARDVLELIRTVQCRVEEQHGVRLQPEVKIIGEE